MDNEQMDLQDKMNDLHVQMLRTMLKLNELPIPLMKRYFEFKKPLDKVDGRLREVDLLNIAIGCGFSLETMKFEKVPVMVYPREECKTCVSLCVGVHNRVFCTLAECRFEEIKADEGESVDSAGTVRIGAEPEPAPELEPAPEPEPVVEKEPEPETPELPVVEAVDLEVHEIGTGVSLMVDNDIKFGCKIVGRKEVRGITVYSVETEDHELIEDVESTEIEPD
jgi:hypothetical protein